MPLAGSERTLVVYGGGTWLLMHHREIMDPALLIGSKDVVIEAKFERELQMGERLRVRLPMHPTWQVEGPGELWNTHLDGDNVWMFGSLAFSGTGQPVLTVRAVESATSDTQRIASHLEGIAVEDWAARLKAAAWVRDQHQNQPNKEFWFNRADQMISQVVDDAAAKAGEHKNFVLLNEAITWTVDLLKDPVRAGRLASAPWIAEAGGPPLDELNRRLRRLDLEVYHNQWLPRPVALTMEFDDRFASLGWRDAEGYYKLGRWTDINAEILPRAKDRAWRCYQAGYRADPTHPGILKELGLRSMAGGTAVADKANADWVHAATGILVPAPQGWRKGERIKGEITWVDPKSETAYIAASVVALPASGDFNGAWDNVVGPIRDLTEYAELGVDDISSALGKARRLRYRFKEGRSLRLAEILLVSNPTIGQAVRLDAAYVEEEQERIRGAVMMTFDRIVIPEVVPVSPDGNSGKQPKH